MYCTKCSRQITDDSKFCTFCGAKVEAMPTQPVPVPPPQPVPTPQPAPLAQPSEPIPAPIAPAAPAPEPQPVPSPPTPVPPPVQFTPPQPNSFAELKFKTNMAGFDVRTIRCSRCGHLIFLPDQGNSLQCATCQNVITAKEILDRAREALR